MGGGEHSYARAEGGLHKGWGQQGGRGLSAEGGAQQKRGVPHTRRQYLHDVNGQLTMAVAVQPRGIHILGPARGLHIQGSGHQHPHVGLRTEHKLGDPESSPCPNPQSDSSAPITPRLRGTHHFVG